jgi:hypothetical protein
LPSKSPIRSILVACVACMPRRVSDASAALSGERILASTTRAGSSASTLTASGPNLSHNSPALTTPTPSANVCRYLTTARRVWGVARTKDENQNCLPYLGWTSVLPMKR